MAKSSTEAGPAAPERAGLTAASGAAGLPRVELTHERLAVARRLGRLPSYLHVLRGLSAQMTSWRVPRSILGLWWIPIMIVVQTLGMAFVFGGILNVPSPSGIPYLLFVSVGAMAWWVFHRGALFSMRSFHLFRHYVTMFSFPLILVPLAGIARVGLELAFFAGYLILAFTAFWIIDGDLYLYLSEWLLLVPLGIVWLALLAYAIGLVTGPVFWRARDVRMIYRMAIPFLMLVTPIVYPLETLSGTVGTIARLNPLAPPVELVKKGLLGVGDLPLYSVAAGITSTVVLLALGVWFTERYAARLLTTESDDALADDEL